jgi:hypothetical protein
MAFSAAERGSVAIGPRAGACRAWRFWGRALGSRFASIAVQGTMDARYNHLAALCLGLMVMACSQNGDSVTAETTSPRRGDSTEERARLPQSEVTPELAAAAQRLLEKHPEAPFGTEFDLEYRGERYVARIEEHYHEPGGPDRPYGHHRGVTLYRSRR